jgi:hypothetical protein
LKLKTIGLALVASAFMTSTAFAQAGTMQPIPNPPEKAKAAKHHKKHAAKKVEASADTTKKADTAKKDEKAAAPAKK